ncbi:MAG: hypothetical protein AAF660_04725 [Pseudomonadota bacterium]
MNDRDDFDQKLIAKRLSATMRLLVAAKGFFLFMLSAIFGQYGGSAEGAFGAMFLLTAEVAVMILFGGRPRRIATGLALLNAAVFSVFSLYWIASKVAPTVEPLLWIALTAAATMYFTWVAATSSASRSHWRRNGR